MATKNNRRTKLTKQLLKSSLIELIQKKSLNQITIKELCENADLNRSTFYLHYSDQYQLMKDIEDDLLNDTLDYLKDINTSIDAVNYIKTFLKYVKSNVSIFRILLCQPENATFQNIFIQKTMGHIKDRLPSICPTESEKYIYDFVMHGSLQIIRKWLLSDFDMPISKVANLIYRLCNLIYSGYTNL